MTDTLVRGDDGDNDDRRRLLADVEALTERRRDELIEALKDEQHRRCAYGTREGDGGRCDCKFHPDSWRPWGAPLVPPPSSEVTGCPELRSVIWMLEATP